MMEMRHLLHGLCHTRTLTARLAPPPGHDIERTAAGICRGIASSFNATPYLPTCNGEITALAREARGLRLQHDEE